MPTARKPTAATAEAIDQFCAAFDDLFARYEERLAFRHYLIGLLLPREHNKTVVELEAVKDLRLNGGWMWRCQAHFPPVPPTPRT
jgi:hypothetical protein